MKFTLTYDGDLPSNGGCAAKWAIRKQIDPQLRQLWQIHPSLQALKRTSKVPKKGGFIFQDSIDETELDGEFNTLPPELVVDLCEPIERKGRRFLPLIRDNFKLKCALKIMFLRQEVPGKIYQGGDLDNRIKTLFDSLQVPNLDQVVNDEEVEDPMYCLMEDDAAIMHCDIETHQLLSRPGTSKHDVHLVIQVDVRVTEPKIFNNFFIGD